MWESHADSEIQRVSKPGPETVFPTYVVSESDKAVDDLRVAAVTTPQSTPDQVKKSFLRLLPGGGGVQHGSPFPGKELLDGLGLRPCRPAWHPFLNGQTIAGRCPRLVWRSVWIVLSCR